MFSMNLTQCYYRGKYKDELEMLQKWKTVCRGEDHIFAALCKDCINTTWFEIYIRCKKAEHSLFTSHVY